MNVTGIILAGGKSSRMGIDKGLMLIEGKPMVKHVISALQEAGIEDLILVSNNLEYAQFGIEVFPDLIKEKGPLGGIYTGLSHSLTENNLLVSCDTPFIESNVLQILLDKKSNQPITICKFRGQNHPLIGMYSKSILTKLQDNLEQNKLKVEKFNEACGYETLLIEEDFVKNADRCFANINSKEDLNYEL